MSDLSKLCGYKQLLISYRESFAADSSEEIVVWCINSLSGCQLFDYGTVPEQQNSLKVNQIYY